MFRFMRKSEKVKRYLLIFFLGIVSVGMVLVLAPLPSGDTSRMESNNLAEIGGRKITTQDLDRMLRNQFKGQQVGYNPAIASIMAEPLFDEMVQEEATRLEARKLGLVASPDEVLRKAQATPGLYDNGVFIGREQFERIAGMTLEQWEDQLRDSLVSEKLRAVITDGVQVTPAELHDEFIKRNAKAKIEYVVLDPSQFIKEVKVTPEALDSFFKQTPSRYKLPEQRRVRYVLADTARIQAQAKVTDDDIKQYYGEHLSDYRVPDRVKAAHILFKTTGKTPAEVTTIENTARDVLSQVRSGKDFGELAKRYSEDSSAQKGGEIGWIVRGQTVKEFETAAFSMHPGQTSDLIKTVYGIHILKVLDKQSAHLQSVDEVKNDIRTELERRKFDTAQQAMADYLGAKLKENPKDFEGVARKAGLEVKETPLFKFKETLPDFGNSESFANLAFQLRQDEVGQPITIPKGLAIIQLIQIVPEHQAKLEEVRATVEQDYRNAQSKVVAAEKARQLADKGKSQDFKAAAKALGLTVKESNDFTAQDNIENVGTGSTLSAAFTTQPGQTSDVVAAGTNWVVFHVLTHTPANEADLPRQRDQIAEELADRKRTLAFDIYRRNLKQQLIRSGELKINTAAVQRFESNLKGES
ncbi:MAG: peptidyl-prolyl cis-trans isomerase [Terriglobia bacterium]